jgi:hypothetical protein
MAMKYRQMYDDVLGTPAIATVGPRVLDNKKSDARRA